MTQDRPWYGRAALGDRRLRALFVVAIAMIALGIATPCAGAASGGAGLGGSAKPKAKKPAPSRQTGSRRLNPFASRGMWIWYVSASEGGNLSSLIATAKHYRITTLMIKSGDGSGVWSQFTPQLVATLHANGIHVCGWQYVYGNQPMAEAKVGAYTARSGADCLLIDAEGEYEGKYVQAQTYIKTLRQLVGANFPVGLAGFPYIDYHPAFPYSVFLGPGGAQYNVPQMYWYDIGTSTDAVYAHTYEFNRIYQRPINPIGQTSSSPPPAQIRRFRALLGSYGGGGVSWWDWQESSAASWSALSAPVAPLRGYTADNLLASLGLHAQGDVVVWAQEHLVKAGQKLTIDGAFGPQTQVAVENFQAAHGLLVTGVIDTATWKALLRYAPATVTWTKTGAHTAAAARAGVLPVPKSASLPAKRYEIGRSPGRG
jgi:hypothetical protein